MENLRSALLSIKNTVGDQTEQYIRESEHLKEVNQTLQARFNFQAREMEGLQNEIQNLKTIAENSSGIMPCFSSEIIEESHVSRRAEYAKNYEQAAEVNTKSSCKECYKYRDECE
jgi:predicted RNase H-like nuclease (RuvC/YqgF family)